MFGPLLCLGERERERETESRQLFAYCCTRACTYLRVRVVGKVFMSAVRSREWGSLSGCLGMRVSGHGNERGYRHRDHEDIISSLPDVVEQSQRALFRFTLPYTASCWGASVCFSRLFPLEKTAPPTLDSVSSPPNSVVDASYRVMGGGAPATVGVLSALMLTRVTTAPSGSSRCCGGSTSS